MASKKSRSKRQSGTKLSSVKPLSSFRFFTDRSLGNKKIPDGLSSIGLKIEPHYKYFQPDAPDVDWLEVCGEKNWVVLAKDIHIKKNELERRALMNAGVAAFLLTSANMSGEKMLEAIIKALSGIAKLLENQKRPFIARINFYGGVELWLDHEGKDHLKRPKKNK